MTRSYSPFRAYAVIRLATSGAGIGERLTRKMAFESAPKEPIGRVEDEVVWLFDQFRVPLLRYLSGMGFDVADGEDIVQEVFVVLFRHLQAQGRRENLRAWLFSVAHNIGRKHRIRMLRESEVLMGSQAEEAIADPGLNPEDQLARLQIQRHLRAVVQALPEEDRLCLTLRAEGLRYRDIARILGISLGGVSHSLTQSLARISRAAARYDTTYGISDFPPRG